VGEALVAALGFEPTDDQGNGSPRPSNVPLFENTEVGQAALNGSPVGGVGHRDLPGESRAVGSRRTLRAPVAEGAADAATIVPEIPSEPLISPANGFGDGGPGGRPKRPLAETGEFPTTPAPPDNRSSGVKPIIPEPEPVVDQNVTIEVSRDEALHTRPAGDPVVAGDEYAAEANALLGGVTPPAAEPTLVGHTQAADLVDPLRPEMPPLAQPVPGRPATNAGVSARRAMSPTDGVVDRMGELAARVPQLLDEGLFKRKHRVRARKVRRVVRHVDPWSVLTFSVLFHLCLYAALLLASVLVWNAAVAAGTIENIESFIRELGDYKTYEIKGDVVFRAAMVIAGILTLASSVLVVLLTVVFNLISDLVGGIRLTVVEEETVRVRRRRNQ
jgi:hypothetical protein